jgi:hypothetical protein
MKLTNSLVAIAALSTLSFAGGDINPVTVFEQEPIVVPVEPIPVPVVEAPVVVAPAPEPVRIPVAPKTTPPPAPVIPPVVANDFYFGLGATALRAKQEADRTANPEVKSFTDKQGGVTARLGYDFMDYLGAELRGTAGVAKADAGISKFRQYGAYLKPNVDITDALNLYGLVGASKANLTEPGNVNTKNSGLSYGLGLDYGVSDSVSVFVDVMDYLKKSNKNKVYGATLGAAFHF